MNAPQTNPDAPAGNPARKKALTALASIVVVAGLGWAAYEWLVASHYEATDNAYVQGNVIQITPQIGGTVMAIMADDTDFVKAGQPLVKLDPADAKVALDQAEANLACARCARCTPTTAPWPRRSRCARPTW
jgi:membrane fusion protein (multidrug efflux system)